MRKGNNPKVSVVIPMYNRQDLIGRAIASVLRQTCQDFEIIVIDDGSTDDSCKVVKSIADDRIRLIRQENKDVSAARNRGIDEAKAELIAFLDSDDEWKPGFLETVLRLRNQCPEAGVYATAYEVWRQNGDVDSPKYRHIPPAPWEGIIPNYFKAALTANIVCSSAVAIPRSVLADMGRFVLRKGLGQDQDLWTRIALKYPVAFSWCRGAIYHKESDSRRSVTIFTHVPIAESAEEMLEKNNVSGDINPYLQEFLARKKITAASRYVLDGQPKLARSILKSCKTRYFFKRRLWWYFWAIMPVCLTKYARQVKTRLFGSAG